MIVRIRGADRGGLVIGQHHFLVQKPGCVTAEANAISGHFLEVGKCRQPHDQVVRLIGPDDTHIDTTQGCQPKRVHDIQVGHE